MKSGWLFLAALSISIALHGENLANVEFVLPGDASHWQKINEFRAKNSTTVLYFSTEQDSQDLFTISIHPFCNSLEPNTPSGLQSLISCAEAKVINFQKNPSSMFSETIVEKQHLPTAYVCCRVLLDSEKENVITLTYISQDMRHLESLRTNAEALQNAKVVHSTPAP